MTHSLINPEDSLERQNEKLLQISEVLMRRVEQDTDKSGAAYALFERAALLEDQVRQRTQDLEHALDLLNDSNARLAEANRETEAARSDLANAIEAIREGFALFDADDLLVMCNSRFGMPMLDLQDKLTPGLAFESYVQMVSKSQYLALPEGVTPQEWARRRLKRHTDKHVIFNVRMAGDRWVQVSEHRTPNGGTVILQTDVTDIVRLEREERGKLLDDQARMIRATLDHINQGVMIFDNETRLVGWNKKVSDILSVPVSQFRLGTKFDTLSERLNPSFTFLGGMTPERLTDWINRSSGRPPLAFGLKHLGDVTLDVFAREMPDGGFVISFADVTAERDAVQALSEANELLEQRVMERTLELEDALSSAERANASKSRFVAAASHDLLQPLSAAKLYVSSLVDGDRNEADRAVVEKAQNALMSVENIIDALLDISKLDSGAASLDISSVALGDILRQLEDEFVPHAALKGLDLRVVSSSAVVMSDASYLRRILQNLIANAIRYTDSGKVLVGVRRSGRSLRLEVWDTGPGIPDDDQDIIFQEFRRLNARASASEGMGLGLAIVERACARLGHPLSLRSVIGRGSGFFVSVPHSRGTQTSAGPEPTLSMVHRLREQKPVVLLVENDLELRRAMTLLLKKWNVEVLDAQTPGEAFALLDKIDAAPDAFLIDYQLDNGESGLDLLDALLARHGDVPSRIVSADRSAELRQMCKERGVELLSKPIDPKLLENFLVSTLPG